jgi:multidrug resistance efflux pump
VPRTHLFTKKARQQVEVCRRRLEHARAALDEATKRAASAEAELEAAEHELRMQEDLDRQGSGFGFSADQQRAYAAAHGTGR